MGNLALEIKDAIGAFKGTKEALDYSEQNYRNELYRAAKRENDRLAEEDKGEYEGVAEAEQRKQAGGLSPRGPGIQTTAASGTPGTNENAGWSWGGGQNEAYPPGTRVDNWGNNTGYTVGGGWGNPRYGGYGRFGLPGFPRPRFEEGGVVERAFDPEGPDYDYKTARLAGLKRGADGHWPSRDPVTGMQLKGRAHPTFDKAIEEDRRMGYGLEKQNGRYYTQKFRRGGKPNEPVPDLGRMPVADGSEDGSEVENTEKDWQRGDPVTGNNNVPGAPYSHEVSSGQRGMSYEELMALHRQDPTRYGRPRWRTALRPPVAGKTAGVPDFALNPDTPPAMRQGDPQVRDDDPDSEAELLVKSLIDRDVGAPQEPPPVTSAEVNRSTDQKTSDQLGVQTSPPPVTDREVAPERTIREGMGDFVQMNNGKSWPEHRNDLLDYANDPRPQYAERAEGDRAVAANEVSKTDDELRRVAAEQQSGTEAVQAMDTRSFLEQPTVSTEPTSAAGRWLKNEITQSPEAAAIQRVQGKISELVQERQRIDPGLFGQTTPVQRAQIERRTKEIDAEIARLEETKKQIAQPGAGSELPGPAAAGYNRQDSLDRPRGAPQPAAPNLGPAIAASASQPRMQTNKPLPPSPIDEGKGFPPTPPKIVRPGSTPTAKVGPNQVPQQGDQPRSNGNSGPQGGNGASPAPPATAMNTGAPPRKPLGDQTRREAYDPTADANDPRNIRAVDASGRTYTPQEIAPMVQDAVNFMRPGPNGQPPVIGQGAVRPETLDRFAAANSQGGKLSKGEALLAGMLGRYRVMLKQGRIREASMMAAGIMQAANLEAAAYGRSALDAYNRGDYKTAAQKFLTGINNFPDGREYEMVGNQIVVRDPYSKQVLGSVKVDGQQLLAGIMGLADGSAFWQALQQTANMFQKPDKNAELRALDAEIKRRRIRMMDQKIAAGVGGKKGPAAPSADYQALVGRLTALGGGAPAPTQVTNVYNQGGGDDTGAGGDDNTDYSRYGDE